MKNVLLLVHDDDGQEARLQAALDLTRCLSGHLTCLDLVRAPEFMNDYVETAGHMIFIYEERDRASENRERIESRLTHEDVSWDWVRDTGEIGSIVSRRIDMSDIVVLNSDLQDHGDAPDMRAITSKVAVKSGKPILAVPEENAGFEASGPAMVAWDGSAPAIKALQSATPILSHASSVFIVEADYRGRDDDQQVSSEDAATYLSRHGIEPTIQRRELQAPVPIASLLLGVAKELGTKYLVAGAYGHSRITETVFGGVTRALLTETTIPLILAH